MDQKMASKPTLTTPSVILTPTLTTVPQNESTKLPEEEEYHTLLLVVYTAVLLIGSTSLSVTLRVMKSRTSSTTSIAVLNLIFAHFLFLLTVPFRIYYHAAQEWSLGLGWCRVVSSMVHIHMYMSFGLYVVIIITRLLVFYHKAKHLESSPGIYAQAASVGLWMIVLVIVTCIIYFSYGQKNGKGNTLDHQCFRFANNIKSTARVINYIISTLFITVAIVLTGLQANVLWLLYRKHHQRCTSQQDFGAQRKSLSFAVIMVVCFIPYHIFRLYYLEHHELQNLNEVFLSLTTLNCVDTLTLLGRRTCSLCVPGKAI
ncbi:probable G-protein coupled receptor 141 isoform X2 [Phyllopteryx taeniolatus]|uniref:probable G-protein coupled receptor 141 isoform X2 n=1 Tax=Phyllopteryx taeniolatus TaxID=161469 RepID=UPI002AD53940|nr:probable G-protein coupled receptor 141 isoform X2 [Phyllopteryx taeniolatus]